MEGQIIRIGTLADGSIRVVVDIQPEHTPPNLLRAIGDMVNVEIAPAASGEIPNGGNKW